MKAVTSRSYIIISNKTTSQQSTMLIKPRMVRMRLYLRDVYNIYICIYIYMYIYIYIYIVIYIFTLDIA